VARIELDADHMSDDERKAAVGGKRIRMRADFKR